MRSKIFVLSLIFLTKGIICLGQDSQRLLNDLNVYYFYSFELIDGNDAKSIKYHEPTKFPNKYENYYSKNISQPQYYKGRSQEPALKSEFTDSIQSLLNLKILDKEEVAGLSKVPCVDQNICAYLSILENNETSTSYHHLSLLEELDSLKVYDQKSINSLVELKGYYEVMDGNNFISPNGKISMSFYINNNTYNHNESGLFEYYDSRNDKKEPIISVNFKSWMPSPNPCDYFWLNDSEIILKIFPIREFYKAAYQSNRYGNFNKIDFTYLKIKVNK